VVALVAVVSAVATLALRDPASARLDQEAARLSALLESARAEARSLGLAVTWRPQPPADGSVSGDDFRFDGLPATEPMPTHWLSPGVVAEVVGAPVLVLGPEPMIGAQRVVLRLDDQQLALATDGLGPFVVVAADGDASGRP
jgi:general secretion pathway protein H